MKNLNISCLGACYLKTKPKDLYVSLMSIFINEIIPKQTLLVLDGPVNKRVRKVILFFVQNYNLEILELKNNKGLGMALAEGLKKCKFNYVARFDTDDINMPKRLEIQFNFLKNNPHISVVGSNVIEFRKKGKSYENRFKRVPISPKKIKLSFFYRNCINHPSVLFKRSDILQIGNYKSRIFFEDYDLWLRLLDKNYKFSNFAEPLVLMKREDAALRRDGISYVKKEFIFVKKLRIQFFKKMLICIFLFFRIIFRFIFPSKAQNFLPWRSRWKPMNQKHICYLKLLEKKYNQTF